jgi:hypothetical protein
MIRLKDDGDDDDEDEGDDDNDNGYCESWPPIRVLHTSYAWHGVLERFYGDDDDL